MKSEIYEDALMNEEEEIINRQGWRLNHFPGKPVPMMDNPFSEEKFPNIQSKPPLLSSHSSPRPVALHGAVVAQVQNLALSLVESHTIGLSPSIQPIQIPLQSLPTLQQINTPAQLGVICKLTEGALNPFVQIIDKDIKQNWPQHRPLGDTTCDQPPTGYNATGYHHHSLGPAIQPVLYPVKCTPVQAMSIPGEWASKPGFSSVYTTIPFPTTSTLIRSSKESQITIQDQTWIGNNYSKCQGRSNGPALSLNGIHGPMGRSVSDAPSEMVRTLKCLGAGYDDDDDRVVLRDLLETLELKDQIGVKVHIAHSPPESTDEEYTHCERLKELMSQTLWPLEALFAWQRQIGEHGVGESESGMWRVRRRMRGSRFCQT
ncbi:hypothetical protein QYF61_020085 [Mycteria americana]|uniref:Uncharacterized protein n=1 Tax=Mycteria americana TaxID=33587 RepID=A0AAN7S441_MYCAM|nr:hypothetical protein QYF61_020085 [Mycteria americana]